MFVLILSGRRADYKARAILVLRLRTANLLYGATLKQEPLTVAQTSFRHSKEQDKDNKQPLITSHKHIS